MRDCLADGKYQLMFIQLAAKQNRQNFRGTLRGLDGDFQFGQPLLVMKPQLFEAKMQAREDAVMRWQYQRIHG